MRILSLSFLCILLSLAFGNTFAAEKPNIVFILADDLGWKDLSNEGSTFYESPNLDRLVDEGMKFTRGYAACQVCSPSRASILTGKYPTNHGVTSWIGDASGAAWGKRKRHDSHYPAEYDRALRENEVTLAEALKEAGYRTFFAGKWHLGGKGSWPTDHGFDINVGGIDAGGPRGGFFAPYKNENLPQGPDGESLTLRLGQETADFIKNHSESNGDAPFLAYLSFYTVHGPIQTTPDLWKKYRDKAATMGLTEAEARFKWDRRLAVRQVQDCPIMGGMIESMDDAVGMVMKQLEDLGIADNTIVCFTSDNGGVSSGDAYATSNLPLRGGKGRQWEGGIREPFYIKAPGVTEAGATSEVPVNGIDWYPTLLELAGIEVPKAQLVDGVSLVPLLKGGTIEDRPLFWHYPHYGNQGGEPSSIISHGKWKLIHYHEDGRDELYDLENDEVESTDVASANPKILAGLKARLDGWLKETNAIFPEPDPNFDPLKREAKWSDLKTKGIMRLEGQHANFLAPDFKPNKDWWGSAPVD